MAADDPATGADRNENGTDETVEHIEAFDADDSGYANDTPTYSPVGKLTL